MIRINNIRVPLDFDFTNLVKLASKKTDIPENKIKFVELAKKSVDARKKSDVHFIISINILAEPDYEKKVKNAISIEKFIYKIPKITAEKRPVIVGFGPAGMFASLVLALAGIKPIVLERGLDIDSRVKAVETFQNGGILDPECNVQFGEGGAGTFSDGKLTTGIKDKRIGWILEKFVEFGAPHDILYLAKPHIGTDKLRQTVKNLRKYVISLGGEVRFGAKFIRYETNNNCISSAVYSDINGVHEIETDNIILASGHSARDVFEML